MGKKYVIGVDIGTTSTKSVLFSRGGELLASHNIEYMLSTPTPTTAELDPEVLFQAVIRTIRQVVSQGGIGGDQVLCVSFSSAMHSVIAVDAGGIPLTNVITWADNRSAAWAERIKKELNGHLIYLRTGTPVHAMSPLAKLAWLSHDEPELFARSSKFISIKEYVFYRLFKEYVIDHSIASATGMFHLERLDWDEEALQIAGVTPDRLSTPVATTHACRGLDPHWAAEMGLSTEVPFVVGASDGVLSNLGVDAMDPGAVAITIGTSGAIRTVTTQPVTDPNGRIFCYALADQYWVIGGPVNNGGMIFRWVRDQLGTAEKEEALRLGRDPYELLTELADKVKPGADGLLFHPYLAGERAPLWDPNARGSFFGLSLHHKREHLVRAALEGILFNLYSVFAALEELIGPSTKIQATGGFARSVVWRQMMSDIFDRDLYVPESVESSCLGAAVLGLYGIGELASLDEGRELIRSTIASSHHHTPNKANAAVYHELAPIYMRVSQALRQEYAGIAAFQQKWIGQ